MNHAVECTINVTGCIIGFSRDLGLLQAVCWEKSSPDCAHANRYLWSHSFWFPLQHYFHTLVCCSLSLNFLLLQVVWLQHSISLPTPLQGWENIQLWKQRRKKTNGYSQTYPGRGERDPNLCLLTLESPNRLLGRGSSQFVQGIFVQLIFLSWNMIFFWTGDLRNLEKSWNFWKLGKAKVKSDLFWVHLVFTVDSKSCQLGEIMQTGFQNDLGLNDTITK